MIIIIINFWFTTQKKKFNKYLKETVNIFNKTLVALTAFKKLTFQILSVFSSFINW